MGLRPIFLVPVCIAAGACFDPPSVDDPAGSSTGVGDSSSGGNQSATTEPPVDSTGGTTTGLDTSGSTGPVDPDTGSSGSESETTAAPEPEIEVSYEGTALVSGEVFVLAPNPPVGGMESVTITVENVGTGTLEVGGLLPVGGDLDDFSIEQSDLDGLIEAGDSSDFQIVLAPIGGGLRQATFDLASNDGDESPFTIVVQGHTEPNSYRLIEPPVSPIARFNSPLATLSDGRILMFGGRSNMGDRLDDTWIYDPATEEWTSLELPEGPSMRDAHALAGLADGRAVLFGGNPDGGGAGSTPGVDDTWRFDAATETWANIFTGGTNPSPRFQHSMTSTGNSALLFGGRSTDGDLNDVWMYDGVSQSWGALLTVGAIPPTRATAALAFDGDDTVTLFGGFDGFNPLSDTRNLRLSTATWITSASPPIAGARAVLEGAYFGSTMVLFSGKLDSCCVNPAPGTFHYDSPTDIWSNESPPSEPTPRYNYGMARVPERNTAIIFGGQFLNGGPGSAVAETWEYVGPLPER